MVANILFNLSMQSDIFDRAYTDYIDKADEMINEISIALASVAGKYPYFDNVMEQIARDNEELEDFHKTLEV